ncbi:MAG TPA: CBS domain-containing protein [Desulfuromonadales bacterium]|nr:CBS domain-containing protein [Desulfuromonadales bacterium]
MKLVKDVQQTKEEVSVFSIAPDATVLEAITFMAEKNVGALPVMDGETLVGILSERDYARKVLLMGRSSNETLVRDIMTDKVITVTLNSSAKECIDLMTEKQVRHLPVVENGRVTGVVSIGDVVKLIIAEQTIKINSLQSILDDVQSDKNLRNLLHRELNKI